MRRVLSWQLSGESALHRYYFLVLLMVFRSVCLFLCSDLIFWGTLKFLLFDGLDSVKDKGKVFPCFSPLIKVLEKFPFEEVPLSHCILYIRGID